MNRACLACAVVLLCAVLCSLAASCNSRARESEPAASLPSGWPLKELQLPQDARRAKLFGVQESLSSDGGYSIQGARDAGDFEGELWALSFETATSWQKLIPEIESQLRKAGYSALENPIHGTPSPDWPAFQYLSADGEILLLVARSSERSGKDGAKNICIFKLTRLREPYSGSDRLRSL